MGGREGRRLDANGALAVEMLGVPSTRSAANRASMISGVQSRDRVSSTWEQNGWLEMKTALRPKPSLPQLIGHGGEPFDVAGVRFLPSPP